MKLRKWHIALLVVLWIVLVLYPNPVMLAQSVERTISPPVNPVAVDRIASDLPDDPVQIESLVLTKYVPYAYDWTVHNVPWYFPTVGEVAEAGRGDCKARAVMLASLLEAKNIPYEFNVSPVHVWVDYPGKTPNPIENADVAVVENKDGVIRLKKPNDFDVMKYAGVQIESLWDMMPVARKIIMFGGIAALLCSNGILALVSILFRRYWPVTAPYQGKTLDLPREYE